MTSSSDVYGLVPTGHGCSIVAVGDLTSRLDSGEELEEAVTNAGIDSFWTAAELPRQVERVRQLNLTGDASAFWADPS